MKETNKDINGSSQVIETSPATKKKISAVAVKFRDKKLFQEKVETVKASLVGLKSLPI